MTPARSLDEAIDELYGLDPAEFTARRDVLAAEARRDGDRDLAAGIKSLRRPSVAASAVNLLARSESEEIERLTAVGSGLRRAQEELAGEDLRTLGRQRQQLIAGLVQQARQLADRSGRAITDAAAREVEATFEAALADEAAGRAVRQGRLVRTLQRTGMDPVDLRGAVARASGGAGAGAGETAETARTNDDATPDAADASRDPEALAQADRETADAVAEADEAEARLAAARSRFEEARQLRSEADATVARLQQDLTAARDRADIAAEDERAARQSRLVAEDAAETARADAERARKQADGLRRGRPEGRPVTPRNIDL